MGSNPFAQEGYDLMGAAFEVHREVGGGLLEEFYQECFEVELGLRSISFQPKAKLITHYKTKQLKKEYIPDLVAFGGMIVELKAV